jgi:signal transduction histidine kinase
MRLDQARRFLSPPWMPTMLAAALGRACRARALVTPVRLVLPATSIGTRLARALHAVTGVEAPCLAAGDATPELRGLPLGATLVLDPAGLDAEGLFQLEALVDEGDVWVIAVTGTDAVLPPAIGDRLAAVVVDVPPLGRRQLELPALSASILQVLAARAGRPVPSLTQAARTRLAMQPWPGDLLELETTLARALASTDAAIIDASDLGFDPVVEMPAAEAAEAEAAPRVADAHLEALLAELAHEILNPLSTVKMLVSHLPQLVEDVEARTQLGASADEAVTRVDDLLQNVLAFARLGAPHRREVPVAPLLDRLLDEAAPELAERSIRVRRTGAAEARCIADPAQIEYGLRNLLAGVVREVPPREEFVVDTGQNGVVAVRFAPGDVPAARLRAMVAPPGDAALGDPTVLPLAFTLARAVIERNGGSLAVQEDDGGPTTLVVRLPTTAATG